MNAIKKHTDELAEQPRKVERATCPICGESVAVKREAGARILEYHHIPGGYMRWCDGSDVNIDQP